MSRSSLRLRAALGAALALSIPFRATSSEPDPAHTVALRTALLDTRTAARAPRGALREGAGERERPDVLIVKFPAPVTAAQDRALKAAATVYAYLPHFAYLVRPLTVSREGATTAALSSIASLSAIGASWTGVYEPAYKLSPSVGAALATAPSEGEPPLAVLVELFPDADLDAFRETLRELGIRSVVGAARKSSFSRVRLLLSRAELGRVHEALANRSEVLFVDVEARRVLLNDTTVWVCQSGVTGGQATPVFTNGIFGQGQVVAILDTGIDPDMCYFRDPARGLPPRNECDGGTVVDPLQRKVLAVDFLWTSECAGGISATEWDTHDHGTHVAGTAAGDNFANPLTHDAGDGMAPGAKLVIQDGGLTTDNCADLPGIGCPVVDLVPIFQQTYTQGARIHSNSWGDQENAMPQNDYTAATQDADEFTWNHKDFLILFAAGNSGPGTATVGSPSVAKNVVSVGATLRGASAESMASFSSCGPTDDGRIKPDVTVPGSSIVSADNDLNTATNNCGSRTMSGTSMATPGAAGLAALARQYFADGFHPTGQASAANAFQPSAALVKAVLVNSAQPMTGSGTGGTIPASCQGWGRVHLDKALAFPGDARQLWVKDNALPFPTGSSNDTRVYSFTVAAGEALKATLVWSDYPAAVAAGTHLVNDLDLVVAGPGGTYLGNVFSSGQSTTGGSADRKNTVEQVLLNAPAAGTYTVTVRSFNVPNGPQPFALVVTGAVTALPPTPQGAKLYTLAPCRLLDTRNPAGPLGGPALAASTTRGFPAAGSCGIPADAQALAANVTAVNSTTGGYLTTFAAGEPRPATSGLNFAAGQVRANNAILPLSGAGLSVFCGLATGSTDLVVDVVGYFK